MNLESLHNKYLALQKELFGRPSKSPYMIFERQWYDYCKAGFDESDLELVMRWIKWSNKTRDYQYNCTIQALLDLEKFSAWHELALGWQEQNKKPKQDPNRVDVLRATFREPEQRPCRPVGDVFKAMREASE